MNWKTGETVAVKHISLLDIPRAELSEIMSEIDLLKNLKHPNIVKYRGSDKTSNGLYIILEYCENGSLQHICKRFGRFPEGLVSVYIYQVLLGLAYLHEQGVIHRDIKGANILTTKDGAVKLADFGVATKAGAALAADGQVVGSPYWMAPEVIDQSGATTASDIWSVGCVVVELLEGQPPYHFLAPMPALFRIVQDECPPLPEGASTVVKDFLLKCFQKDVDLRASAKQLLEHPWMMSAKWQLERLSSRKGAKTKQAGVTHDEAVKTVKKWNEALRDLPVLHSRALRRSTASMGDLPKIRPRAATAGSASPTSLRAPLQQLAALNEVAEPQTPTTPSTPHVVEAMSVDDGAEDVEGEKMATLRASKIRTRPHTQPQPQPQASLLHPTVAAAKKGESSTSATDATPVRSSSKRCPSPSPISMYGSLRPSQAATAKKLKRERDGSSDEDDELAYAGHNAVVRLSIQHEEPPSPALKSNRRFGGRRGAGGHAKGLTTGDLEEEKPAFPSSLVAAPRQTLSALPTSPRLPPYSPSSPPGSDAANGHDAHIQRKVHREQWAQACADVAALADRLSPMRSGGGVASDGEVLRVANDLEVLLLDDDAAAAQGLVTVFCQSHGTESLLRLMEDASRASEVKAKCVQLLGLVCATAATTATTATALLKESERFCLLGGLSTLMSLTSAKHPLSLRTEAAYVLCDIVGSSVETLRCALGCQGPKAFVRLVHSDYSKEAHLVHLGVKSVALVLANGKAAAASSVDLSQVELCRIFAHEGLLEPLTAALVSAVDDTSDGADDEGASLLRDQILRILLVFSTVEDAWVKQRLAQRTSLRRLLMVCLRLAAVGSGNGNMPSTIILLRIIRNLTLSGAANALDELQNCNAVDTLVRVLAAHQSGKYAKEVARRVLYSLFNLTRLNRSRQEELAACGGVPLLMAACENKSALLRHYALPILCDLAATNKATRKVLSTHNVLPYYLRLLAQGGDDAREEWQTMVLEAIVVWLQEEQQGNGASKVEDFLLRSASIQTISAAITRCNSLESLVEPLAKLLRASPRLAAALGQSSSCPQLLRSLAVQLQAHPKAVVRLNLLRILKLVLCPATADMPERHASAIVAAKDVVQLVAKKDAAVLVRKMARELLMAIRSSSASSPMLSQSEDEEDDEVQCPPAVIVSDTAKSGRKAFDRPATSAGIQRARKPRPLSLQVTPTAASTPATPRTGSSSGVDELLLPASPAVQRASSSATPSTSSRIGRTRSGTVVPATSQSAVAAGAVAAVAANSAAVPSSPWSHLVFPLTKTKASTGAGSNSKKSGLSTSISSTSSSRDSTSSGPRCEAAKAATAAERQRRRRPHTAAPSGTTPSFGESKDEPMRSGSSSIDVADSVEASLSPPRTSLSPSTSPTSSPHHIKLMDRVLTPSSSRSPSPAQRSSSSDARSSAAGGGRRVAMQRFWSHYRHGGASMNVDTPQNSMDS